MSFCTFLARCGQPCQVSLLHPGVGSNWVRAICGLELAELKALGVLGTMLQILSQAPPWIILRPSSFAAVEPVLAWPVSCSRTAGYVHLALQAIVAVRSNLAIGECTMPLSSDLLPAQSQARCCFCGVMFVALSLVVAGGGAMYQLTHNSLPAFTLFGSRVTPPTISNSSLRPWLSVENLTK